MTHLKPVTSIDSAINVIRVRTGHCMSIETKEQTKQDRKGAPAGSILKGLLPDSVMEPGCIVPLLDQKIRWSLWPTRLHQPFSLLVDHELNHTEMIQVDSLRHSKSWLGENTCPGLSCFLHVELAVVMFTDLTALTFVEHPNKLPMPYPLHPTEPLQKPERAQVFSAARLLALSLHTSIKLSRCKSC